MAVAADLSELLIWCVAFALASLALVLSRAIATPFVAIGSLPIIGTPFRWVAEGIQAALVDPLNAIVNASEAGIAYSINQLIDAVAVLLGIPLVILLGVEKALQYLWNQALRPLIHSITDTIQSTANRALALAEAVPAKIKTAVHDAEVYTDAAVAVAAGELETKAIQLANIAKIEAVDYADWAVGRLRAAEDASIAVANASLVAVEGELARLKSASEAAAAAIATVATREGELAAAIAARATEGELEAVRAALGEAYSLAQTAKADALSVAQEVSDKVLGPAITTVRSIAITVEDDIGTLIGNGTITDAARLLASVTAIGTLLYAIAKETGLENSDCRSKVKDICATNPAAWTKLIGAAAFFAIALDFRDFVAGAQLVAEGIGAGVQALEQPFIGSLPPLTLAA